MCHSRKLIILSLGAVLLDQLSKILVKSYNQDLIQINDRFALSMGPKYYSIFLSIAIFSVFIFYITKYCKQFSTNEQFAIFLIAGGGLSNIIDRLLYGGVVDFIKLYSFPVFNIADAFITTGIFYLIISFIFISKQKNSD